MNSTYLEDDAVQNRKQYEVKRLMGGGQSWLYLLDEKGRVIMCAHDREEAVIHYMQGVVQLLNVSANN